MKKLLLVLLVLFVFAVPCHSADWYVDIDNDGGTEDGTAWATAWGKLTDIVWGSVSAGDTVWISDGEYNQRLVVGASGSAGGGYIYIKPGEAHPTLSAGHTGVVYIDGTGGGGYNGVTISSQDYIEINGNVGGNRYIVIRDWYYAGFRLSGTSDHIVLTYVEITQNNQVQGATSGVYVSASWNQVLFEMSYCKIHDNLMNDEVWMIQPAASDAYEGYDSVKIHHNEITNFHADAMKIAYDNISIYNNTIHGRGTFSSGHPDGIQNYGDHNKIYNNKFYDFLRTDDNGGNSYIRHNPDGNSTHPWGDPHDLWIYNNLFYETNTPLAGSVFRGIEISYSDPSVTTASGLYIYNNTIVGTPYAGIILAFQGAEPTGHVSDLNIENNIVLNCGWNGSTAVIMSDGLDITAGDHGEGVDIVFDYNSLYTVTTIAWAGSIYSWTNFLALDVGMVHGINTNPSLGAGYIPDAAGDPVVDAGVTLAIYPAVDIVGTGRPQDGGWDIGAYEYLGGGGDVIAPTIDTLSVAPAFTGGVDVVVTYTCSDAVGVTTQRYDIGSPITLPTDGSAASSPQTVAIGELTTGNNQIWVGCCDAANNCGTAGIWLQYALGGKATIKRNY